MIFLIERLHFEIIQFQNAHRIENRFDRQANNTCMVFFSFRLLNWFIFIYFNFS